VPAGRGALEDLEDLEVPVGVDPRVALEAAVGSKDQSAFKDLRESPEATVRADERHHHDLD
jgi:hypothetical protein